MSLLAACGNGDGGDKDDDNRIPANPASDFEYRYDAALGGVVITGYTASTMRVRIPERIEDEPVVAIGNSAFRNSGIMEVHIPDSVTSIGGRAFCDCTGLTSITIPDSVTTIGNEAFSGCTGLTSINIPDSVTSIGGRAFYDCTGLTSITIPDSVTHIGVWAFVGCTGLTSVTLGSSVTTIGEQAFSGCTALTSINIPNSVTHIGEWAFDYTSLDLATRQQIERINPGAFGW